MSLCLRALFFASLAASFGQAQGTSVQPLRLVPPVASGAASSSATPAKAPTAASSEASPGNEEAIVRVRAELEALLDAAQERFVVDSDSLYTEACSEHGYVGPLLEELELLAESEEQPEARRRVAEWTLALLLRRRGDLEAALERFEPFAEDAGLADDVQRMARLHRAELLDALGRVPDATSAFRELLEFELDEELETHVRLRVALLEMSQESGSGSSSEATDLLAVPGMLPPGFPGGLAGEAERTEGPEAPDVEVEKDPLTLFALEEGRDPLLRNRAAVVLGLSDRPAEAIELFQVPEGDKKPFRSEVRLAEWALRAEQPEVAQERAWRAVRTATLRRDRDYGLAVLVEAHRLDESLDALVDKIAATPNLDEQMRRVWIELLRERGRYDEAIALFRAEGGADGEPFSIEERRQLLEMYREKGDEDVMISVYRELIASEPTEVEWREGLSRALLERGERDAALELWSDFLTSPASASRRLEGAQVLMDLGLDDLALQAAEICIADQSQPYAALIFLFGLHKNRGQLTEAEAALERMEALAPPDAAERFQLAD
ncbi:MAG: tetratricopeptide repeat protein, partial [Planctomycetota bacterium]